MAGLSKRKKLGREKIESTTAYQIDEALTLVKELASAKFAESIDVSVNLGELYEKSRLQVAVQILGRSTPVELDFGQVEKG